MTKYSRIDNVSAQIHDSAEAVNVIFTKPRSWLVEFLLIFSTFGVFACVWMVYRISELRKLTNEKFRVWLWFFVPLFALAQIFAFPKFTRAVKNIEKQYGHHPFLNNIFSRFWVAVIIATTVFLT